MSDSSCIDSPCKEGAMPKSYSSDLRKRVIGAVEAGASRHEAAERFEIVPSTAVRWLQCWNETGSCAPKPRGGSVSHLEAHSELILALITARPDLTLKEMVGELLKRRIRTSKSAVQRFLERHDMTFKKRVCGPPNSSARTSPGRGGAGSGSKACLIPPDWYSSTRLQSLPTWCGFGDGVREASN